MQMVISTAIRLAQRGQGIGGRERAAGDVLVAETRVGVLECIARPRRVIGIVELYQRGPRESIA